MSWLSSIHLENAAVILTSNDFHGSGGISAKRVTIATDDILNSVVVKASENKLSDLAWMFRP